MNVGMIHLLVLGTYVVVAVGVGLGFAYAIGREWYKYKAYDDDAIPFVASALWPLAFVCFVLWKIGASAAMTFKAVTNIGERHREKSQQPKVPKATAKERKG